MSGVNKVIILGHLGQDPELRYTPAGAPVCTLSVATSESYTGKDGSRQETTEWHKVIVWNKQAENCAKYLAKGRQVYLEGKLCTRSWDDKQSGQKRYATEIIASTVQFISDSSSQRQQPAAQAVHHEDPTYGQDFGPSDASALNEIPF